MADWTNNRITIKGSKEDLAKMMGDAIRDKDGNLKLSSWFPVPETFKKYDTTNHPNGKGLRVGKKIDKDDDSTIITKELIEEYKQATREQKELYGVVGWYDFNLQTFGCKWDCEVYVESEKDDEIVLITDTPWEAPEAFLHSMSERYPALSFCNHASFDDGCWEERLYENGSEELLDGEFDFDDEDDEDD